MRFLKSWIVVSCVASLGACATSGAGGAFDPDAGTTGPQDAGTSSPAKDGGVVSVDAAPAIDDAALPPAPAPAAVSIAPSNAPVGALGPTVIVSGTAFVLRSLVRVDGAPLTTTFVSATELRAALPTTKLATAGVLLISVETGAPGGGLSADLPFEVQNPPPVPTTLSPTSAVADSPATSLTVTGSAFASGAKVYFDAVSLLVSASSATSITATIPAAQLTGPMAGSHNVTVVNPTPGGGTSAPVAFTVTNPSVVSITSVTPSTAMTGDANTSISIVGAGFVGVSAVSFNGTAIATTYVDGTHLTAVIPAALLVAAGNFNVVVTNPAPGGGVSVPSNFQVQNPVPTSASLSPNTAFYQSADKTITINGTGFVANTVAKIGVVSLVTTPMTSTQLTAVIPQALMGSLGTLNVYLVNAGPGGGSSSALPFYVICNGAGVDVNLGTLGSLTTRDTNFATAPTAARINSSTCPTSLSASIQPYRTWAVQNTTSSSITLSAWAVCAVNGSAQDDAFLAFYRTAAPPVDRTLCAPGTVASEGASGTAAGYSSPSNGGSNWCPGLTKANNGGMAMSVCEVATVYISPFNNVSTLYTPPSKIQFMPQ